MFSMSVLNSLATFGYFMAAFGFILCILAYFAIPKLIKKLFQGGDNNENS